MITIQEHHNIVDCLQRTAEVKQFVFIQMGSCYLQSHNTRPYIKKELQWKIVMFFHQPSEFLDLV